MKRPPNHDDNGYDSFEDEEVDKIFSKFWIMKVTLQRDYSCESDEEIKPKNGCFEITFNGPSC